MKNEVVKEFLIRLAQEKEFKEEFLKLQKKVTAESFSNKDNEMFISECLVPWSKRLGYNLTRNDFITFDKTQAPNEITGLSQEELANVSGGIGFLTTLTTLLLVGTSAFGGTVGNFTDGSVLTPPKAEKTAGSALMSLASDPVPGGDNAVSVVNDTFQNSPDSAGGAVVTGSPSAFVPAQNTSIVQSPDSPYSDLINSPAMDGSSSALYNNFDYDQGPGQITNRDYNRDYGQTPANHSASYIPDHGGPSAASTNSSVGETSIGTQQSFASRAANAFRSGLDYTGNTMRSVVNSASGTISSGVNSAVNAISSGLNSTGNAISSVMTSAAKSISSGVNSANGTMRSVKASAAKSISSAKASADEAMRSGMKTLEDMANSTKESLRSINPSTAANMAAGAAGATLLASAALAAAANRSQSDNTNNVENEDIKINNAQGKTETVKDELRERIAKLEEILRTRQSKPKTYRNAMIVLNQAKDLVDKTDNDRTLRQQLDDVNSKIKSLEPSEKDQNEKQTDTIAEKKKKKKNTKKKKKGQIKNRRTAGGRAPYTNRVNNY